MLRFTEFVGAMIRTVAAIIITVLWLSQPAPIALIVPSDTEVPTVLNNFSYMQYGDQPEEDRGPIEIEVQVTGGSMAGTRNLYEEIHDRYYITTSHCNEEAFMDFAVIRVYVESGYQEIEFDHSNVVCRIRDISYTIPHDFDPNR